MFENSAWITLHFHSSLSLSRLSELDTNEYNSVMKGFHFPSTTTTNSIQLILGSQYSLYENYNKRARLLWGLKQVLGSNMIPVRTKFDAQTTVVSHRRRKQFSSSAGLLFRSEFSDRQSTLWYLIFHPMEFPFVWAKYKWKFMRDRCKLSFPQPFAASPLAHLNRRACSQDTRLVGYLPTYVPRALMEYC